MPNGKRKVCPAATDSMPTLLDMIDSNNNVIFVISDCTAWHCRHLQYIVKAQKRRLVNGMTIYSILPAAVYISYREIGTPRTIEELLVIMSHLRNLQKATEYFTWKLDLKFSD